MKNVDYEPVIIGGGPAGLTAVLYATRYGDVGQGVLQPRGLKK